MQNPNVDLERRIEKAHADAERIESEARAIEGRILKIGGIPPKRPYGRPVDPDAIKRNLTLTGLLNRRDPQLASYLGVQNGDWQRQKQEQEARAAAAQRMQEQTERLRAINAAAEAERLRQMRNPLPYGWKRS